MQNSNSVTGSNVPAHNMQHATCLRSKIPVKLEYFYNIQLNCVPRWYQWNNFKQFWQILLTKCKGKGFSKVKNCRGPSRSWLLGRQPTVVSVINLKAAANNALWHFWFLRDTNTLTYLLTVYTLALVGCVAFWQNAGLWPANWPPCARPAADGWPLCGQTVRYRSANQANSAFHHFGVNKWLAKQSLDKFYLTLVAPSSECLQGKA